MNKLRLLIIEDDKDFRDSYAKQIKLYNIDHDDFEVEAIYAENEDAAKVALKEGQIDAAIVDLKLGNSDVDYKGNEIIDIIKSNLRFPAFIVTANPEKIELEKQNENDLFKIRIKGSEEGNFTSILEEFKKIHLTGITKILGKSGLIEEHLNTIFWTHLSTSMDLWINDTTRTPEEKQKTLLRYTLLHIQEYLELTEDSDFENYHPSEIYITPCIKPNVFTGDLVGEKDGLINYIVLTPSCDLAQAKAKDILVVQIEPPSEGILSEKVNLIKKDKDSEEDLERAEKILKDLINNRFSNKYHFLPKYREIEGGLINFQKMRSVKVKEFNEKFIRIASINSTFTKDIVARFSYYYSRQGSPDFNTEEVYASLIK
jgi:CheY-like chemotaxis protein